MQCIFIYLYGSIRYVNLQLTVVGASGMDGQRVLSPVGLVTEVVLGYALHHRTIVEILIVKAL